MKSLKILKLYIFLFTILGFDIELSSTDPNTGEETLELVPVQRIKGTQLFSGLFYQLGMKRFPVGWVTWAYLKTPDKKSNYVQIACNPKDLPHYEEGHKWHKDMQWGFTPSDDKVGFYVLRNKQDPTSLTTVLEVDGFQYVILNRHPNQSEPVLWRPMPTSEEGFYTLKTNTFPEGSVTWTDIKYGNFSHYLQVSIRKDHIPKFIKGAEWYDDTLFRLESPEVELTGSVYDLEVSKATKDVLKYKTIVKQEIRENWKSYSIFQNITDRPVKYDEFILTFDQNLKAFTSVTGTLILQNSTFGSLKADFKLDSTTSGNVKRLKTPQVAVLDSEIELQPGTSTLVTIHYDMRHVEIPFKAKMVVHGQADRILANYSGIRKAPVPLEFFKETLRTKEFQLDLESSNQDSIAIWVSGIIKGSLIGDIGVITAETDNTLTKEFLQPDQILPKCPTEQRYSNLLKKCVHVGYTNFDG